MKFWNQIIEEFQSAVKRLQCFFPNSWTLLDSKSSSALQLESALKLFTNSIGDFVWFLANTLRTCNKFLILITIQNQDAAKSFKHFRPFSSKLIYKSQITKRCFPAKTVYLFHTHWCDHSLTKFLIQSLKIQYNLLIIFLISV
jgi:hypothetical protein